MQVYGKRKSEEKIWERERKYHVHNWELFQGPNEENHLKSSVIEIEILMMMRKWNPFIEHMLYIVPFYWDILLVFALSDIILVSGKIKHHQGSVVLENWIVASKKTCP